MKIGMMVDQTSEQKVQQIITVMPVLKFTTEMLECEDKFELSFKDMLELFSSKIEEKEIESVEIEDEVETSGVERQY